jgi:hypothetical protein
VALKLTVTGLVRYHPLEQPFPLHDGVVVGYGCVVARMASFTVRTIVPEAARGFSQSRNAVKVAGRTELVDVQLSSQMP